MQTHTHVLEEGGDVLITLRPYTIKPEFLCSSKRLMEASPLFERALRSMRPTDPKPVHIDAEHVEPGGPGMERPYGNNLMESAVLTVLSAIHFGNGSGDEVVERHLADLLPYIAAIAALVEYYECLDFIDSVDGEWVVGTLSKLENLLLRERGLRNRDYAMLLDVAWGFRRPSHFQEVTSFIVKDLRGPFKWETLHDHQLSPFRSSLAGKRILPISHLMSSRLLKEFIGQINQTRETLIRKGLDIVTFLTTTIEGIVECTCSERCKDVLTGYLDKLFSTCSLVKFDRSRTLENLSYSCLCKEMEKLERDLTRPEVDKCFIRELVDVLLANPAIRVKALIEKETALDIRLFVTNLDRHEGHDKWKDRLRRPEFRQGKEWQNNAL